MPALLSSDFEKLMFCCAKMLCYVKVYAFVRKADTITDALLRTE